MIAQALIDYSRYKNAQDRLSASLEKQQPNEYFTTSLLWKDIFSGRSSAEELSDLLVALSDKFSFADGIGGGLAESKKSIFIEYYKTYLSKEILRKHPMPWLGSPSVIDFEGCPASGKYLSNLRLFEEVRTMLVDAGWQSKLPLRILEIGAGYGGLAYFLLQSGMAEAYTVIDLPENLRISAFYLTQIFQESSYRFLSCSEEVSPDKNRGLSFVTPGNIKSISRWRFDLVINSDSLGEMPAATAKAYVNWIRNHLAEGGYFFSKNGHNRGADCIQLPRDFGYHGLTFVDLRPPTAISSLFDDFSHYALLQKKDSDEITESSYSHFDALCALYATGLQEELGDISKCYVDRKMNEEQQQFLNVCHQFFASKSLRSKLDILTGDSFAGDYRACISFLTGLTKHLMADHREATTLLSDYSLDARSYIADAYSRMIIAKTDPSVLYTKLKFGARTRFAIDELLRFQQMKTPFRELALKLRSDILRKKVNYPANYTSSPLVKSKNLLFNLKEGRGWTTRR